MRRAISFTSGNKDSLGLAPSITVLLGIMRGQEGRRELRSPVSYKELEGRGTILSSAGKPLNYHLRAKNQSLFPLMELYLLAHRVGLIWHPENSKGKAFVFVCVYVCRGGVSRGMIARI